MKSIVIVAPNSFRRIHHQSWENQFQLLTQTGEPASLVNLNRLLKWPGKAPEMEQGWRGTNPMAGYYLESYLKRHGYEARTVFDWEDDIAFLEALRCDPLAIAFSTTYVTDNQMLAECVSAIRRLVGTMPIVIGGPYIWKQRLQWERDRSLSAAAIAEYRAFGVNLHEDCLFGPSTDAVLRTPIYVTQEFGEYTLLRVLEGLQATSTSVAGLPNTVTWNGLSWDSGDQLPEPVNLDEDYTRWDLVDRMPALVPIRTSVGCPFRCRYCDFIELHPKVIKRSPGSLMEEVRTAHRRGGRFFNFIDDNIFLTKERIQDLATTILRHEMSMVWGGFFRVDRIDEANIQTLYRSGCRYGMCGIESADDDQLERMRKGCRQHEVRQGINLATEAGMQLLMTFIIGYPGETQKTVDNTIRFINTLEINHKGYGSYQVYPFYLLPSTAVDGLDQRREHQLIGRHASWRHTTMTADEARDVWAPYFLRHVTTLPYEHYATDCPVGWTHTSRNAAFAARRQLTLAFCDNEPNDVIQERFRDLYRCVMRGAETEAPNWSSVLAPRQMQPGHRQARARLGG